jgi:hypothetical protein
MGRQKYHEYVSAGQGLDCENNTLDKEAFVIMLTCINGRWKIPRRSKVTGQDTGYVATFSGRPFHDLRCS